MARFRMKAICNNPLRCGRHFGAEGVLALPASATTLRLLPPLVWERAQVDELLAAMGAVLA